MKVQSSGRALSIRVLLACLVLAGSTAVSPAQPVAPTATPVPTAVSTSTVPQPLKIGDWAVTGSWRLRGEHWNWFDAPGFDDEYSFAGSLLRIGIGQQKPQHDVQFEVAIPALMGLPDNAVAPAPQGQLGFGGTYSLLNEGRDSSLFLKQGFVCFKNLGDKNSSLRLGRFEFWDGNEATPKDAALAWLKRERINHRLIGNFGFSHVGRSYDGVQLTHQFIHNNPSTSPSTFTLLAARPTEGVFKLNGWGEVDKVGVAYGSLTKPLKSAEGRLFALYYRDTRDPISGVPASFKTDNRPAAVRAADDEPIGITTLGGHYISTFKAGAGTADLVAWGALQFGDWGTQSHRASALALEAGYQPKNLKLKPWLRVGYFRGSGDTNPGDNRHETFFQVLPTPRIYARFPFYNLMNNEDLFAQIILRPAPKLTLRADAHRLKLSEAADLWYAGGGAFEDTSFGYAGRPGGGSKTLANLFDLSLEYSPSSQTSLTLYLAVARGKGVIANVYPTGQNSHYAYIEITRRF